MRTWWILLVLGGVFAAVGVPLLVAGVRGDDVDPLVAGVGMVVFAIGLAAPAPLVRREQVGLGDPMEPMQPVDETGAGGPSSQPWPFDDVAREVARVLADHPYVVQRSANRLRVRADLADARFVGLAGARRYVEVALLDVVPRGQGRAVLTDAQQVAQWSAGVGAGGLRLSGSIKRFSGRRWAYSRRTEIGVDEDGLGAKVDYEFSTAEMRRPVVEVLERAGWRTAWPIEAKVGLVWVAVGVLGGLAAVVAVLATR